MSEPTVLSEAQRKQIESWRASGARIVFTNGVFDLLHRGHVEYLAEARAFGHCLVVGMNSDDSVRRLGKGSGRPLVTAADRAAVLASLRSVDLVVIFDDDTPERLIREVRPDVLAKGGDWPKEAIVGGAFVESYGGRVVSVDLREGHSTSNLVERIRQGTGAGAG
jgi:rfaE bifunctional protein nucleotidyltransferase chain/domain